MEQKRKVKSLISISEAPELGFLSKFLIALSFFFCFLALSLTIFSISFVSASNDNMYQGLDEKTEVLYKLDFVRKQDLKSVINTIEVDDKGGIDRLYIAPNPVVIKHWETIGGYVSGKYVNLLGGYNLDINSDNITVIGGNELEVFVNNDNATILGGKNNDIRSSSNAIPNVIIGGENNTVEGNNAVILGGRGNTIEGKNSFILGGEFNTIGASGDNVIVAGKNVVANQKNVFVFSNDNNVFTPGTGNAFYINVQEGLGINMNVASGKSGKKPAKGVTVGGAVKFGNLVSECDNIDDYGLIGLNGDSLKGCSSYGKSKIGIFNGNERTKVKETWGICTGADYLKMDSDGMERYKLCKDVDYKNVVFETKFLTGGDCPTISSGKNPCVFKCASGYTYDKESNKCMKQCEAPWDNSEFLSHNTTTTSYSSDKVVCENENTSCEDVKAVLKCVDGKWWNTDKNEVAEDIYKYKTCQKDGNSLCNKDKYQFTNNNIENWEVVGVPCNDYKVEGKSCVAIPYYEGNCYENHTLTGTNCKLGVDTSNCICEPKTQYSYCSNLPENAKQVNWQFKQTASGKGEDNWYPKSMDPVFYPYGSECTYKCNLGYLYFTGNDELKLSTGCWTGCNYYLEDNVTNVVYDHGTIKTGFIYPALTLCGEQEYICINGEWKSYDSHIKGDTSSFVTQDLYETCRTPSS